MLPTRDLRYLNAISLRALLVVVATMAVTGSLARSIARAQGTLVGTVADISGEWYETRANGSTVRLTALSPVHAESQVMRRSGAASDLIQFRLADGSLRPFNCGTADGCPSPLPLKALPAGPGKFAASLEKVYEKLDNEIVRRRAMAAVARTPVAGAATDAIAEVSNGAVDVSAALRTALDDNDRYNLCRLDSSAGRLCVSELALCKPANGRCTSATARPGLYEIDHFKQGRTRPLEGDSAWLLIVRPGADATRVKSAFADFETILGPHIQAASSDVARAAEKRALIRGYLLTLSAGLY